MGSSNSFHDLHVCSCETVTIKVAGCSPQQHVSSLQKVKLCRAYHSKHCVFCGMKCPIAGASSTKEAQKETRLHPMCRSISLGAQPESDLSAYQRIGCTFLSYNGVVKPFAVSSCGITARRHVGEEFGLRPETLRVVDSRWATA